MIIKKLQSNTYIIQDNRRVLKKSRLHMHISTATNKKDYKNNEKSIP